MKSYYGGPIGITNALLNGTIPTPYVLPFPKIGGSQPQPKTAVTTISGTGKAIDCKCGWSIQRVHPIKSPWKIWEKKERGHIQGLPKFFEYPLLSQEWVKLQTSNFVRTFTGSIITKAHLKILAKVAVGILRDSQKFSGHPHIGRIVQSSLRYLSFVVLLKHLLFIATWNNSKLKFAVNLPVCASNYDKNFVLTKFHLHIILQNAVCCRSTFGYSVYHNLPKMSASNARTHFCLCT